MTTTYKITITKTEVVEKKKLWAPLKLKTPTEIKRSSYGGGEEVTYTEEYHEPTNIVETNEFETDIYEQVVEKLDLVAVINAINGIEEA